MTRVATYKQIATLADLDRILDQAEERGLGFGPGNDPEAKRWEPVAREIARRAAHVALMLAGATADMERRDRQRNDRLADKARREHEAWCKATGHSH